MEEVAQGSNGALREVCFLKCFIHHFYPTVPGLFVHMKWRMAHSETRVAALLEVIHWPAKAKLQEVSQAFFSPNQVMFWVHWAENVVFGNLPVKCGNEPLESSFTYDLIQIFFGYFFYAHLTMMPNQFICRVQRRSASVCAGAPRREQPV